MDKNMFKNESSKTTIIRNKTEGGVVYVDAIDVINSLQTGDGAERVVVLLKSFLDERWG